MPYYEVAVTKGRFKEGEMLDETIKFEGADLHKAREEALKCAFTSESTNSDFVDDPSFASETPELIPMLNAFSVNVVFMNEEDGYDWIIYGEGIHDRITGLGAEADYYVKEGLIKESELITILQNQLEEHEEGGMPAFLYANSQKEMPDMEYDVIKVLPADLARIIGGETHTMDLL